jgi:hypothetical protein
MHFEGNRMASTSQDGFSEESEYAEISGGIEVKREEIISKGLSAFEGTLINAAEQIKKQKAELLLNKIKEISEKTGNVANGQGKPFSFELFLELLEKMQIDFDESGNPSIPTLVISPKQAAFLKEKMPEWERNEAYQKKYKEIIDKKRVEWNDRESNRKLVD